MSHTSFEERAALDAALSRLNFSLPDDRCSLLIEHLNLLEAQNSRVNLTSIRSIQDAVVLHLEDSLAIVTEFSHSDGLFCDIGTGGGFPGIPLAIATDRPGVLLDSVKKKARAVQGFVEELGLGNQLQVRDVRSEELAKEMPGVFDTVVARAVSSLSAVEELATPLLAFGGRFIAMRGSESKESLAAADHASQKLGLKLVEERGFQIGSDEIHRSVYVYERVSDPKISLPRRPGVAQKHPLN